MRFKKVVDIFILVFMTESATSTELNVIVVGGGTNETQATTEVSTAKPATTSSSQVLYDVIGSNLGIYIASLVTLTAVVDAQVV